MTDREIETGGTPRWVKVVMVITLVLVALIVVLLATGRGGGHGPGRHLGGGDNSPTKPGLRPA